MPMTRVVDRVSAIVASEDRVGPLTCADATDAKEAADTKARREKILGTCACYHLRGWDCETAHTECGPHGPLLEFGKLSMLSQPFSKSLG